MSNTKNDQRTKYLEHIKKQVESGLSIKKYCESNDLSHSKFSHYRTYKLQASQPKKPFTSVKIKAPSANKSRPQVDPRWLAEFIHILVNHK